MRGYKVFLLYMVFIILGILITFVVITPKGEDKVGSQKAFEYLNQKRAEYNEENPLPPLYWNEKLYEFSIDRARDMSERGYVSHVTPEGHTVATLYGFGMSEAIVETGNGKEAVNLWLESEEHSKALLSRPSRNAAIGCYNDICVFLSYIPSSSRGF